MTKVLLFMICGIGLAGCEKSETSQATPPAAPSVSTNDTAPNATTQPDNTGINARDQSADAVTAGSQGQGKSDVVVTADIRKRIMAANMSVDAQNVKVVSQNGKVTLRGPVDNQNEKDSISQIATDIAGADNVDNQLDIKPSN
jgi:hyperosmotically inducible periplasmic protein